MRIGLKSGCDCLIFEQSLNVNANIMMDQHFLDKNPNFCKHLMQSWKYGLLYIDQSTLSCNTILYACAINEVSTHVHSQLDDLLKQSVEWLYSLWKITEISAAVSNTFKTLICLFCYLQYPRIYFHPFMTWTIWTKWWTSLTLQVCKLYFSSVI